MKQQNDLIEKVVIEVLGEEVIPLIRVMKNKVNLSEFKLAEKINKEVNATRNLLYKLHDLNLASFIRRKDKKKGWYIYYWTLQQKNAEHILKKLKKKKIEALTERLRRESSGNFFVCPEKCIRLDFERAFEFEFKCPECGAIISQEDNREKINELEEEIKKLKRGL
jgi:transcription initiation factor TFIIE subunit alpha